jgi:hypothetical protein
VKKALDNLQFLFVLELLTWGITALCIGIPVSDFLLYCRQADGSVILVPVGIENERE